VQAGLARREAAGRVGPLFSRATLPDLLAGQPRKGWTKNRHFGVGSARNGPATSTSRLMKLAVFASNRSAAELCPRRLGAVKIGLNGAGDIRSSNNGRDGSFNGFVH
jgi:hypothetical protein